MNKSSYSDITEWPRITVITPSFNHGRFIKRTIESVLKQKYPNLEYKVVDGGSEDDTISILKSYGRQLKWISEKDNGQTEAINKGLKTASGEIVTYLNSDDTYIEGALSFVGAFFYRNKKSKFLQGKGRYINSKDRYIKDYDNASATFRKLHPRCTICQPACFWRVNVLKEVGFFDDSFEYAMDYEYWVRLTSVGIKLNYVPVYLANSRDHRLTKTNSQEGKIFKDIVAINRKYYGYVHDRWLFEFAVRNSFPKYKKIPLKYFRFHLFVFIRCLVLPISINKKIFSLGLMRIYYSWLRGVIYEFFRKR